MEGLREAVGANAIKRGVGILYDDIEPSKVRGTRAGSSLDDVKNLTEVGTSSTLHARFRDIVLEELQPRIFTTNASHAGEWHSSLPQHAFLDSSAMRCQYSSGIKAVFKRTVWVHVQHSLISAERRAAYEAKRRRI